MYLLVYLWDVGTAITGIPITRETKSKLIKEAIKKRKVLKMSLHSFEKIEDAFIQIILCLT